MSSFQTDLVRPLAVAENVFLEVLLSNFTLRRYPYEEGVHLEIAFDSSTLAVWNRAGREVVRERMRSALALSAAQYEKRLNAILFGRDPGTFAPDDDSFLWRWASAGTLPVISIRDRTYYCLFFRDIFPI